MTSEKSPPAKPVRLDRMLSGMGYGSRREIAGSIKKGDFCKDGEAVTDPGYKISPCGDESNMTYRGEPLDPVSPLVIVLNKPVGYVCGRDDAGPVVYDLLPRRFSARKPALAVAGRLDKESSGIVILTDDGDLAHRIMSPKTDTPKIYEVELEKDMSGDEAEIFAAGTLMLRSESKPLKPVEMTVIDNRKARLVLHEGRYHQVRRMFASQGNHVLRLHRSHIGGVDIEGLAPGEFRIVGKCAAFSS